MARTAPPNGRAGQLLNGIGALAVVALITALPFVLVWAAGNPLPAITDGISRLTADPGAVLGDFWQALSNRDDGDLFLHALAIVGWVAAALAAWAWISFLVAFVIELGAQLRGHRRGRVPRNPKTVPGMRLQQRAAAVLAAAIIGAIAAPTLASASAMPPTFGQPAAAAARHAAVAEAPAVDNGQSVASATTRPTYLEVPVQRGESLLDIAERHGVSPQRLAEANYNVAQPDGRSLQPGSMRVYGGWTLRVPVSAQHAAATVGVAAATPAISVEKPAATAMVYEIARGDWLSGIAERFLGDADRYTEIAAINPDLEERDNRFPNHIQKDWRITLPADAHDRGPMNHARGVIVSPASSAPATEQPPAAAPPQAANPAPTTAAPTTAAPTTAAPTTAAPSASTTAPTTAPSAAAPAAPTPAAPSATSAAPSSSASQAPATSTASPPATTTPTGGDADGEGISDEVVVGSLAGAGLLSALLLAAVLGRRHRQRQHRRPGRRLPHPRGGATEKSLRVVQQPADVDRLDVALRSLAAALTDRDQTPLPDITAAWIIDRTVQLVLAVPHPDPPAPWAAEGSTWTLPGNVDVVPTPDQLAPLPTLVAVGSQPGRHLLLDLERTGSLTITGDPERTIALLRYIACELACNSWSDDVEVIIAGFTVAESELLVALNPDRIRPVASVAAAASRLKRRAAAVAAALSHTGAANTFAGRITDVGEAWAPQVLLVAHPDRDDLAALAELGSDLTANGPCAVAIVAAALSDAAAEPSAVVVDADGQLRVSTPALRTTAAAAGLPAQELEPLAEIMREARTNTDEPTPAAPEPEEWAADTDAAGAILTLLDDEPAASPARDSDVEAAPAGDDPWAEPAAQPALPRVVTEPAPPSSGVDPILAVPRQGTVAAATPRREVTAAIRQRRRQADPNLDADLAAWHEQDQTRPRIGVLGPVTVDAPGPAPDQRRRFHAEIITFLAARGVRGATGDQLTEALWPDQRVKDASRRVAITRARRWLGETSEGEPWLPEMGSDRVYRLEPGYLLDWHLFRRLRTRGEAHGPAGVKDLRAALDLVRGVPLDGADRAYAAGARNPFTWLPESDIYPGHITSAIVDTAHELAELYHDAGDTAGMRWAVQTAWLADPHRGDDDPWHDLMRAARIEGHTAELRSLLGDLMRTRDAEVPEDLSPETYAWLRPLLPEVLSASTTSG